MRPPVARRPIIHMAEYSINAQVSVALKQVVASFGSGCMDRAARVYLSVHGTSTKHARLSPVTATRPHAHSARHAHPCTSATPLNPAPPVAHNR